jgi:hypothetical protein
LVAEHNRLADALQARDPLLSREQALSRALSDVDLRVNNASVLWLADNNLPTGTDRLLGGALNTTPEGIGRQKDALEFLKGLAKNPVVNFTGKALGVLDLMLMATEVQAALNKGDTAEAGKLAGEWAASEAGGWLLGGLAVTGAAAATVALGVPAIAAAGFILTAGLVGGYVGGEATKLILNKALDTLRSDLDTNALRSAVVQQNNGNDLGVDYTQGASKPAVNPIILDNAVDTTTLNPGPANPGENGVLGGGAGHTTTMVQSFVNDNGFSNTASSGIVTDFTRPGNHSLANTDDIMNGLRMQAEAWRDSQRALGGQMTATAITRPATSATAANHSTDIDRVCSSSRLSAGQSGAANNAIWQLAA